MFINSQHRYCSDEMRIDFMNIAADIWLDYCDSGDFYICYVYGC